MKVTVLFLAATSITVVSGQETTIQLIKESCEAVQEADRNLCEFLKSPNYGNREKLFPGIQVYIQRFEGLSSFLHSDTNKTLQFCNDVFEEQGAHFMHIRFDHDDLINGFQWDEKELEEYEMWRGKTLEAWIKCEKCIYKHGSFQIF